MSVVQKRENYGVSFQDFMDHRNPYINKNGITYWGKEYLDVLMDLLLTRWGWQ